MIRRITKDDKKFYLDLCNEFYSSDAVLHSVPEQYFVNNFNEMMRSDDYLLGYIIEFEGKRVGFAVISKAFACEIGGFCVWIEDIYILKEYRDKSLGKEFFNFIFNEFKGTAKRFRLEATKENQKAISLYKKIGFEVLDYVQLVKDEN